VKAIIALAKKIAIIEVITSNWEPLSYFTKNLKRYFVSIQSGAFPTYFYLEAKIVMTTLIVSFHVALDFGNT
jgi:hypothetical protein